MYISLQAPRLRQVGLLLQHFTDVKKAHFFNSSRPVCEESCPDLSINTETVSSSLQNHPYKSIFKHFNSVIW